MNFDDVDALAMSLPGVTVETKWGNRTWMAGGKGFAWRRPFSKADLKRFGEETPPAGEILAVRVAMGVEVALRLKFFDSRCDRLIVRPIRPRFWTPLRARWCCCARPRRMRS